MLSDEFLKSQAPCDWDWCYPPDLRVRAEFMDQYEVISLSDLVYLRRGQCHGNSLKAWEVMPEVVTMCTGFGLSTGLWMRHSWVLNEGEKQIAECTPVKWERYYGTKLTAKEASIFHKAFFSVENTIGIDKSLIKLLSNRV